jgi:hypothetical protein
VEQDTKPSFPFIAKLIAAGGALGLLVSVAAHMSAALLKFAGPMGAIVSLVFGLLYGRGMRQPYGRSALGGALTGAGCAFVGILLGVLLGDQPVLMLAGGTVGGAIAGAIGGSVGRALASKAG